MEIDLKTLLAKIELIEVGIAAFQKKAGEEIAASGTLSTETHTALDKLGEQQHEIAERLLAIEQLGLTAPDGRAQIKTVGSHFIESDSYKQFVGGNTSKARFEIMANTLTGSDTNVAPDRKAGIVQGDFAFLTMEDIFPHIPTTSNSIEYTRELVFTDNAAETTEALEKPESALTWELKVMPLSNVAHWIKISRQLAADAPALAAYVNIRMIYGVNRRVDVQIGAGNGTPPNISGVVDTGNFTAHGFADAALGVLKKVNLITKMVGSLWVSGGIPTAVLLNPVDWAQVQVDLTDSTGNSARVDWSSGISPRLNGLPVIQSNGIPLDQIVVGDFPAAGTIHDRESVTIEMSDSDDDNFTKNLITIRAERRVALTIERPSMIIAGDLTPV